MSAATRARRLGVHAAIVDGELVDGDVEVSEGRISAVGLPRGGAGRLAVPGFIDLQVNGFAGVDLATADVAGYRRAGEALASTGVTAYQPTFPSAPPGHTIAALRRLAEVRAQPAWLGPRVLPAHLEGPFLAPSRHGAHDPRHLAALTPRALDTLCAAGPVGMVTLAPELDGALEAVARLCRAGVVVCLGHSDATAAIAGAAFDAGASAVTHVLNAMRPITAREPGVAGAALARPGVTVMAIVDGVHLAEATLSILLGAAPGRLCLVTDAIEAATQGDGTFAFGGRPVHVADGAARLDDGTLAGSVLTMDAAVRRLVAQGLALPAAVDAATRVPARLVGAAGLGSLYAGGVADIAVLDDRLEVVQTLVGGAEAAAR